MKTCVVDREEYVPQMAAEVALEVERTEKRKQVDKVSKGNKAPKKKRVCKCGETKTHSMVTSRLCPLNKKYNRFEVNKLVVKRRVMAGAAARRAAVKKGDVPPLPLLFLLLVPRLRLETLTPTTLTRLKWWICYVYTEQSSKTKQIHHLDRKP